MSERASSFRSARDLKTPVIQAESVDLLFQTGDGPPQAPSDASFDVRRGEFVSLIGPSGCGKTTLLRCVAALEHPTGGRPSVNGMSPDNVRKQRSYGYVFQAAGLYPWQALPGTSGWLWRSWAIRRPSRRRGFGFIWRAFVTVILRLRRH
ncbi:hypothetical protein BV392_11535 [Rhodovulum sulfidophilum]|nr:hypothetical protein BV392_11535 [Rhodovulum sulfidophilum]